MGRHQDVRVPFLSSAARVSIGWGGGDATVEVVHSHNLQPPRPLLPSGCGGEYIRRALRDPVHTLGNKCGLGTIPLDVPRSHHLPRHRRNRSPAHVADPSTVVSPSGLF